MLPSTSRPDRCGQIPGDIETSVDAEILGAVEAPGEVETPGGVETSSDAGTPGGVEASSNAGTPGGVEAPGEVGTPGGAETPGGVETPSNAGTLGGVEASGEVGTLDGAETPGGIETPSNAGTLGGVEVSGEVETPGGVEVPGDVEIPTGVETPGAVKTPDGFKTSGGVKTPVGVKTYVLVHGAYHGGWCWEPLARRLRALGRRVFAPTLAGLGERAHLLATQPTLETFVAEVLALVEAERLDDIVLVGHSFGVADRAPRLIRHLVFLDALLLEPGTAPAEHVPAAVFEQFRALARDSGGLAIPAPPPAYFGVDDPEQARWLAQRLTPQPLSTFTGALRLAGALGGGRPVTYIACTDPAFADTARFRDLARCTPGWDYREIATGHNAMVTAPDALAALLEALP